MRFSALFVLFILSGCASSDYTVTLFRTAQATGITERYSVDSKALGTKTVILPSDTNGLRSTHGIDHEIVQSIEAILRDSLSKIEQIPLHGTGSMTTGLTIDSRDTHTEISWPDIDPPKLETGAIDSLYHLMLRAEDEMR
ncbi:MAG TPA: hypothetical protein VGM92_07610 [Candidatus Kapabacteria bacterium]|jgi:hypothetical protein